MALMIRLGHLMSKFAVSVEQRVSSQHLFLKEDLRSLLSVPPLEMRRIEQELFTQTMQEAEYLDMDVGTADEIMVETHQLLFEQYITIENLMEELQAMRKEEQTAKALSLN
ncbi:hypothetical protein GF377_07655 [candidate division GN15 bacterium]|nr:hypothetical protein [candidate division GN15 bacterium]